MALLLTSISDSQATSLKLRNGSISDTELLAFLALADAAEALCLYSSIEPGVRLQAQAVSTPGFVSEKHHEDRKLASSEGLESDQELGEAFQKSLPAMRAFY